MGKETNEICQTKRYVMRKESFEIPHEGKLSEQLVHGRLRQDGPVVEGRRAHSSDGDRMGNERLVGLFLGASARIVQLKVRHLV